MLVSRRFLLVVAVVIIGLLIIIIYQAFLIGPSSTGAWTAAPGYPLEASGSFGVFGQECVNSTGAVYCIGGQDAAGQPRSQIYSSPVSASGIGNWTSDSSTYPQPVIAHSCVAYSGYAYCVGGAYDDNGDDISSAFYAPISPLGVGTWSSTTAFPVAVDSQSCVSASGYVYCIGGENESTGTNATAVVSNSVWYAPLSGAGIGTWNHTTPYPPNLFFPICSSSGGYVYCVGAVTGAGDLDTAAYYATISSTGVGAWTPTTAYPVEVVGQSCAAAGSYLYCVGGAQSDGSSTDAVYYAAISSQGVGTWHKGSNYPQSLVTDCLSSDGLLYCIGGIESGPELINATYYVPLASLSNTTTSTPAG